MNLKRYVMLLTFNCLPLTSLAGVAEGAFPIGYGKRLKNVNVHEHFNYIFTADDILKDNQDTILNLKIQDFGPIGLVKDYLSCWFQHIPKASTYPNLERLTLREYFNFFRNAEDEELAPDAKMNHLKQFFSLPDIALVGEKCTPTFMYKALDDIRKGMFLFLSKAADTSPLDRIFRNYAEQNPHIEDLVITTSISSFRNTLDRNNLLSKFKEAFERINGPRRVYYLKGIVYSDEEIKRLNIRDGIPEEYEVFRPKPALSVIAQGYPTGRPIEMSIQLAPGLGPEEKRNAFVFTCENGLSVAATFPFSITLTSGTYSWTKNFLNGLDVSTQSVTHDGSFYDFLDEIAPGLRANRKEEYVRTLVGKLQKKDAVEHGVLCPIFQRSAAEEGLLAGYDLTGSINESSDFSDEVSERMKSFYDAVFSRLDNPERRMILRTHLLEQAARNDRIDGLLRSLRGLELAHPNAVTLMIGHIARAADPWDADDPDSSFLDQLAAIRRDRQPQIPSINLNFNPASNAYLYGLSLFLGTAEGQRYKTEQLLPLLVKLQETGLLRLLQLGGDGAGMLFNGRANIEWQLDQLLTILQSIPEGERTETINQLIRIFEAEVFFGKPCLSPTSDSDAI